MLGIGFPNSTSSSDRPLLLALGVGVLGGQTGLLEWGSLCVRGRWVRSRFFQEGQCDTSPWNSSKDFFHWPHPFPHFIALWMTAEGVRRWEQRLCIGCAKWANVGLGAVSLRLSWHWGTWWVWPQTPPGSCDILVWTVSSWFPDVLSLLSPPRL